MVVLSPARRVASFDDLELPGDYCLTTVEVDGADVPGVMFLLPIHSGKDRYDHSRPGNGVHAVRQPPHVFRECPDGSLEIRQSIGCGPQPYYWHGFLDEGNQWRQV
jgi:hypothetical protein